MKITKKLLIRALDELYIYPDGSMKKEELKEILYDAYSEKQNMVLSWMSTVEYDLLEQLVNSGKEGLFVDTNLAISQVGGMYTLSKLLIWETIPFDDNRVQIILNEELREVIAGYISEDNRKFVAACEIIACIIRDLVFAYGIIEMIELTKIVNGFFKEAGTKFTRATISEVIKSNVILRYLVDISTFQNKKYAYFNKITNPKAILAERKKRNLTYKNFTLEELGNCDLDLLVETPEAKELIKYLDKKEEGIGETSIPYIIFEFMSNPDPNFEDLVEVFAYDSSNLKDANRCAMLFANLYNCMPQYALYGYSPNEALARKVVISVRASERIGRNEPCMCRKWKKI